MSSSAIATLAPITLASGTTAALMYPADLARALKMASASSGESKSVVQLVTEFRKQHGTAGLFKQGLGPTFLGTMVLRTAKFFVFPIAHGFVSGGKTPNQGTIATKAAAGLIASIPETLAFGPFDVAKLALQLDNEKKFGNSGGKVVRHLVKTHGIRGLYPGFTATLYRQASWTSIYFVTLPMFSDFVVSTAGTGEHTSGTRLVAGLMAGSFGACFSSVGDVLRTNIQKEFFTATGKPNYSMGPVAAAGMAARVIKANGITGLWMGLTPKLLHLGGSGALLAMLVPYYKRFLGVDRDTGTP